jgi:hypothetical protein
MNYQIGRSDLRLYITDNNNYDTYHMLHFLPGITYPQLVNYAESYMPLLRGVSGGGIPRYRISKTIYVTDTPGTSSDVTDIITIIATTTSGGYTQVQIPSVNTALLETSGLNTGLSLDLAQPAVVGLQTELLKFCDRQGNALTAISSSMREKGGQFR